MSVGMDQTVWSRWERTPPEALSLLRNIAVKFSVSADYLLGLTDDPSPVRGEALPEPVRDVVRALVYCTPATQVRAADLIRTLVEQDQEAAARRQQEWNSLLQVLIGLVGPGVARGAVPDLRCRPGDG